MIIFVSHKAEDADKAMLVKRVLEQNGHTVYVDLIDSEISKNGRDLADHLRARLSQCNSLIAIISNRTKESWWVPWEIGVATEKELPLSSYQSDATTPPEYLRKWPILKSPEHLNLFAQKIKDYEPKVERMVRLSQAKNYDEAREKTTAEFHHDLKQAIGQS